MRRAGCLGGVKLLVRAATPALGGTVVLVVPAVFDDPFEIFDPDEFAGATLIVFINASRVHAMNLFQICGPIALVSYLSAMN